MGRSKKAKAKRNREVTDRQIESLRQKCEMKAAKDQPLRMFEAKDVRSHWLIVTRIEIGV